MARHHGGIGVGRPSRSRGFYHRRAGEALPLQARPPARKRLQLRLAHVLLGMLVWSALALYALSPSSLPETPLFTRLARRGSDALDAVWPLCADVSTTVCEKLALSYCTEPEMEAMMRHACPESCGTCDEPLPSSNAFACVDRAECTTITVASCDAAPLVLWQQCPVACRICTRASLKLGAGGMRGALGRGGHGCVDRRADCAKRAEAGECMAADSQAIMALACAASCRTCDGQRTWGVGTGETTVRPPSLLLGGGGAQPERLSVTGCRDERKSCPELAEAGECLREVELMRAICAASCGACVQSMAERTVPFGRCTVITASAVGRGAAGSRLRVHNAPLAHGPTANTDDHHERKAALQEDRLAECADWAAAGECSRSAEVAQLCPCSCGDDLLPASATSTSINRPDTEEVNSCVDSHARCEGWALIGLCASIPVRDRCERSCGGCLIEDADQTADGDDEDGGTLPAMFEWIGSWCADAREEMQGGTDRRRPRFDSSSFPTIPSLAPLPLSAVRLTPGTEFYQAQALNVAYLLSLDPQRLLWSFYSTAGFTPIGEPYGGWESAAHVGWPDASAPTRTLRGHFVGHYLSAASLAYSATGDKALSARVRLLVIEIRRCQTALRSGFVAAWPEAVLDTLEKGSFSQVWAPWYTLHKLLAGLLDAHEHVLSHTNDVLFSPTIESREGSRSTDALEVAQRLTLHLARRVARLRNTLGEQWWQTTLDVEFGGIGEALVRLATASRAAANKTVAEEALGLARAFYKERFLGPLSRGADVLGGLHANTHLPLLTAAAQLAAEEARPSGIALESADEEIDDWEWTDALGGGAGGGRSPRALIAATVHAYCTLQLGYAYAGTGGSSENEHWPTAPASTGASLETLFVPEGLEDVGEANCAQLALRGECEGSAPYMLSHCAASCAARRRELLHAKMHEDHHHGFFHSQRRGTGLRVDGRGGVDATDSPGFHTQESCTQYNVLKVALELFTRSPDAALADAYERKQINGVIGVAHPVRAGEILYMTPMGAGVDKARSNWVGYGEPANAFWCCTGTGIESFATLGRSVFFTPRPATSTTKSTSLASRRREAKHPELWLSQFVPSTALWEEGGAFVQLKTALRRPDCAALVVSLKLTPLSARRHTSGRRVGRTQSDGASSAPTASVGACFSPTGCTLVVRIPSWADKSTSSLIISGGRDDGYAPLGSKSSRLQPGSFLRIRRIWGSEGDASITATFGLYAYSEPVNDWRPRYERAHTLLYGPYVLVGLTKTDERALDFAPSEVHQNVRVSVCAAAEEGDVSASWMKLRLFARTAGEETDARSRKGERNRGVTLLPLASIHDEQRYTAYFTLSATNDL